MDEQIGLFDARRITNRERFERFHRENPQVYRMLVAHALMIRDRGFKHYSMKTIYEVVRWHITLETRDDTELKLNNNYCPYYARKIMDEHEELADFFNLREMRSADKVARDGRGIKRRDEAVGEAPPGVI